MIFFFFKTENTGAHGPLVIPPPCLSTPEDVLAWVAELPAFVVLMLTFIARTTEFLDLSFSVAEMYFFVDRVQEKGRLELSELFITRSWWIVAITEFPPHASLLEEPIFEEFGRASCSGLSPSFSRRQRASVPRRVRLMISCSARLKGSTWLKARGCPVLPAPFRSLSGVRIVKKITGSIDVAPASLVVPVASPTRWVSRGSSIGRRTIGVHCVLIVRSPRPKIRTSGFPRGRRRLRTITLGRLQLPPP